MKKLLLFTVLLLSSFTFATTAVNTNDAVQQFTLQLNDLVPEVKPTDMFADIVVPYEIIIPAPKGIPKPFQLKPSDPLHLRVRNTWQIPLAPPTGTITCSGCGTNPCDAGIGRGFGNCFCVCSWVGSTGFCQWVCKVF